MAKDKLRVAIIGTGMIAHAAHIPAWQDLSDHVDIVACADIVEKRATATAEYLGECRGYGDPQEMLEEIQPDIVSVCTPNCYHKKWTIASLQAGAHVLCEKPIAPGYQDAVEMYKVADRMDRVLFVGQSMRFSNQYMAAKELADEGRLGEVYYAETGAMRRRGVPKWGQFHMQEHSGGGPLFDIGVHVLDALLWIIGSPKVVAASGMTYTKIANQGEDLATSLSASGAPAGVLSPRSYDYREFDVEDLGVGLLRLENGGTICLRASWAANVPEGTGKTIIAGTEAGLTFNPLTLITTEGRYLADIAVETPPDRDVPFYGHYGETAHFLRVIRDEEEMQVKREQVLNVTRALEAIYLSSQEGHEIRIDD